MKQIYFFYIFTLIQLITVLFYFEILVKKFKVPCKYGWETGWIIPSIITVIFILVFYKNEESNDSNSLLTLFFDSILFIGLIPLFAVSLFIAINASGVKNAGGGLHSYCINK